MPTPAPRNLPRLLAGLLALTLTGCGDGRPSAAEVAAADVVLLGDSILDFWREEGQDVGSVLAAELGRPVANLAVGGAAVLDGDIPGQHVAGDHAWVVLEGGANDLVGRCSDPSGLRTVDALVAPDGVGGGLVELARALVVEGHRVALLGYYRMPASADLYGDCGDEFDVLDGRLAALAASDDAVTFVDASGAFDVDDASLYAADGYHPSPAGSAVLGRLLADAIRTAEGG